MAASTSPLRCSRHSMSLTRQLIFLVPAIFILPHLYADPLEGLWHAAPVADGLASVLAITLLVLQVKKFKKQMQAPVENMHTPL